MKRGPKNKHYRLCAEPHRSRYNWALWFGQREFTLVYGEDFACTVHGMSIMVRNEARRRGLKISAQTGHESITVYVLSQEECRESADKRRFNKGRPRTKAAG